jgi:hypothetical protein
MWETLCAKCWVPAACCLLLSFPLLLLLVPSAPPFLGGRTGHAGMVLTMTRKEHPLTPFHESRMYPQVPPVQALPRKQRKAGAHKSPSAALTAALPPVDSVRSGSRSIQEREDAIRRLQAQISQQQQALVEQQEALGLSKQRQESLVRQAAEDKTSRLSNSLSSPSPTFASPGVRRRGRSSWFSPLQARLKPRSASVCHTIYFLHINNSARP